MPLVRGYEISYFDRDLNYIAMSNYSTGSNIVYDIKNNVQIELPEELKYCYFYKFVDDHFILTTQDGMYAFYLDGSYEQTEYENEYYYRPSNDYECYCSQLNKDKMTITNYMTNENVCVLHGAGKSESVVAYFGNRFITSQGNYYTFYDRINSKKR